MQVFADSDPIGGSFVEIALSLSPACEYRRDVSCKLLVSSFVVRQEISLACFNETSSMKRHVGGRLCHQWKANYWCIVLCERFDFVCWYSLIPFSFQASIFPRGGEHISKFRARSRALKQLMNALSEFPWGLSRRGAKLPRDALQTVQFSCVLSFSKQISFQTFTCKASDFTSCRATWTWRRPRTRSWPQCARPAWTWYTCERRRSSQAHLCRGRPPRTPPITTQVPSQ